MKWPGLSLLKSFMDAYSSLINRISEDLKEIEDFILRQQMQVLRLTLLKINDCIQERPLLAWQLSLTLIGQGMSYG
jgi:Mg2+ and Co2+ transporter CorA